MNMFMASLSRPKPIYTAVSYFVDAGLNFPSAPNVILAMEEGVSGDLYHDWCHTRQSLSLLLAAHAAGRRHLSYRLAIYHCIIPHDQYCLLLHITYKASLSFRSQLQRTDSETTTLPYRGHISASISYLYYSYNTSTANR